MLKKYIDIVYKLIEVPRNELRVKKYKENDEKTEKLLEQYEDAYYRSCLKIEEYIDQELNNKDLKH